MSLNWDTAPQRVLFYSGDDSDAKRAVRSLIEIALF